MGISLCLCTNGNLHPSGLNARFLKVFGCLTSIVIGEVMRVKPQPRTKQLAQGHRECLCQIRNRIQCSPVLGQCFSNKTTLPFIPCVPDECWVCPHPISRHWVACWSYIINTSLLKQGVGGDVEGLDDCKKRLDSVPGVSLIHWGE